MVLPGFAPPATTHQGGEGDYLDALTISAWREHARTIAYVLDGTIDDGDDVGDDTVIDDVLFDDTDYGGDGIGVVLDRAQL